jgi:hypothetical protein
MGTENGNHESRIMVWLNFVLHQFIGVWGVTLSAANVTALGFTLLHLFGKTYSRNYFYWMLSGRPYFPIQISLGMLLGWVFGRYVWHRSMVWVWTLPFAYLCYAFFALPTLTPNTLPPEFQAGVGESRLSHYFGWGCGPWNHCIDQASVTLPFYIAAAYSIVGALARRVSKRVRVNAKVETGVIFVVGMWFVLAAVRDSYYSILGAGWHWVFLPYELVTGGIGTFLMLVSLMMDPASATAQRGEPDL